MFFFVKSGISPDKVHHNVKYNRTRHHRNMPFFSGRSKAPESGSPLRFLRIARSRKRGSAPDMRVRLPSPALGFSVDRFLYVNIFSHASSALPGQKNNRRVPFFSLFSPVSQRVLPESLFHMHTRAHARASMRASELPTHAPSNFWCLHAALSQGFAQMCAGRHKFEAVSSGEESAS